MLHQSLQDRELGRLRVWDILHAFRDGGNPLAVELACDAAALLLASSASLFRQCEYGHGVSDGGGHSGHRSLWDQTEVGRSVEYSC